MFDIEYKGGNGLVITTKRSQLVIDPNLAVVGLGLLNVKGAVELATEQRLALRGQDARLCIEGPGEYEIGEFAIRGVAASRHIDHDKTVRRTTMYRIEIADVRIGLMGNIASELSDVQFEELGVIDILILPVGGGGLTLDATSAASIVRSADPKAVIPVHYADPAVTYEMPQDDVEVFEKELAVPVEKVGGKYKVKSSVLPSTLTVIKVDRT